MTAERMANLRAALMSLPFVRTHAIEIVSIAEGAVVIELPYDERFAGPPAAVPASLIGLAGDVAAVSSCMLPLPLGWATATLDFTVKITGIAKGERLRARGRVLQAGRTNSVGAADVYVVTGGSEALCGAVPASTRNYPIKG